MRLPPHLFQVVLARIGCVPGRRSIMTCGSCDCVHAGLAAKWAAEGRRYILFFQDTNALCFMTAIASIGFSARENLEVNSICVPRMAGEAVGAIARLEHTDGSSITCNVEYNQLAPLLKCVSVRSSRCPPCRRCVCVHLHVARPRLAARLAAWNGATLLPGLCVFLLSKTACERPSRLLSCNCC